MWPPGGPPVSVALTSRLSRGDGFVQESLWDVDCALELSSVLTGVPFCPLHSLLTSRGWMRPVTEI